MDIYLQAIESLDKGLGFWGWWGVWRLRCGFGGLGRVMRRCCECACERGRRGRRYGKWVTIIRIYPVAAALESPGRLTPLRESLTTTGLTTDPKPPDPKVLRLKDLAIDKIPSSSTILEEDISLNSNRVSLEKSCRTSH
ncbi:hypothetical protein M409DRAFT_58967 [Zasmidium cellare ATCC 36951]|uniref:Uncharacterized protein n=1 Tax=Zasmidium cellare ATCC 36951 TaxID=1080233 RepID=A0A6A6C744_ZASCE|nr:uncharacterized protein M409DRAFT_58967 [Zasmidium cellare ATCC 36951]KAF2161569.1 hypothetical protein M409DRAFT_58967 [Zasmidium cellare ATCC 36951]